MAETTLYQGVRTMLRAQAGLVALVGDRIRPFGKLKQNETLPAVTVFRVSARRWPGYGRSYRHVNPSVQIDSYGTTEAEALAVAEQVRLALLDQSLGVIRGAFLDTERDWYEEATESYRVMQQWNIHHAE